MGGIFQAYAEQIHIIRWVKCGGMGTLLLLPQQGMCRMHIHMCTVWHTVGIHGGCSRASAALTSVVKQITGSSTEIMTFIIINFCKRIIFKAVKSLFRVIWATEKKAARKIGSLNTAKGGRSKWDVDKMRSIKHQTAPDLYEFKPDLSSKCKTVLLRHKRICDWWLLMSLCVNVCVTLVTMAATSALNLSLPLILPLSFSLSLCLFLLLLLSLSLLTPSHTVSRPPCLHLYDTVGPWPGAFISSS